MIKIKLSAARKFIAILANLSLILNSFVPFLLVAVPVYAQEATPIETPAVIENTPTPEVTPTPEITPALEPTVTPEPTNTPEITPTVDPVNVEIGSLVPPSEATPSSEAVTPTPEITPIPEITPTEAPILGATAPISVFEKVCLTDQQIKDTTNEEWITDDTTGISETKNKVQLGVRYIYPQENKVSITFKCLPKDESLRTTLKIQKIKTSDLALPDNMGSVDEYAFDITTGMKDGDFEYDVTLPKPADSTAEISYIEKSLDEAKYNLSFYDINKIDNSKTEQTSDTVKAVSIDHFTIYIVTKASDLSTDKSSYAQGETVYIHSTVSGGDTDKYYRLAVNPPGSGNNDRILITPCQLVASSLDGSYILPADAVIDNGWKAEINKYDSSSCSNNPSTTSSTFSVTAPIVVPVTNPPLSQSCGLDIALVLDVSGSIDSTELTQMKNAFKGLVDALNGTPTQFSVTKFDTTATVLQTFTSDFALVKTKIDSASGGNFTNWQDGFVKTNSTLPNRSNPNLVIFASDGNPNRTGLLGTSVSEPIAVADAVTIANAIKTNGSRILALGIGTDLNIANMKAISGNSADTGDFLTSDVISTNFSTLATQLAAFASQTCGGTINIKKVITNNPSAPLDNWQFTVNNQNYNTHTDGFTDSIPVTSGTYSVVETQKSGYSLSSAVCTKNNIPVGSSITNGVGNISVSADDIISCNFTNNYDVRCGDGFKNQASEECDNGAQNGTTCTPPYGTNGQPASCSYCSTECKTVTLTDGYCGDNIKNGPEECDGTDGVTSGYSCSQTCTLTRNTGTITIDKVTNPSGDTTDFNFNIFSTDTGVNENLTLKDQDTPFNKNYDTGIYKIEEKSLPTGWNFTNLVCDQSATIDLNNRTAVFDLDNNENIKCTFTNTKLGSVSGTKFNDLNGNGVKDSGEPGILGWHINLWQNNSGYADVSTDVNGNYVFTNLPLGTYLVCESSLSGWQQTYPGNTSCQSGKGYEVVVSAGDQITNKDFGNFQLASISGQKFNDLNNNGIKDTGEPGLPGWTIWLDKNNNNILDAGDLSTTTDANGNYTFNNLTVGTYHGYSYGINEVHQTGWTQNYPAGGTQYVTVTSGTNATGIDFGNHRDTGTIELSKSWSGNGGQTTLKIGTNPNGSEIDSQQTGTNGSIPLSTGQNTVITGTYYLSEINGLTNYTTSPLFCFNDVNNNGANDTEPVISVGVNDSVLVAKDQHVICTYTNTRKTGNIKFDKVVSGGTALDTDWTFTISGQGTAKDGDTKTYDTGSYTVTESGAANYSLTGASGVCSMDPSTKIITLNVTTAGGTCTITNTRDTGTLRVFKNVDLNGDGDYTDAGETGATNWHWQVDGGSDHHTGDIAISLPTGTYHLTETNQTNYHLTGLTCTPNGSVDGSDVTITKGTNVVCTFTNARDTGTIIVHKDVRGPNDEDITDTSTNFTARLDGSDSKTLTDNGTVTYSNVITGNHSVTEYNPSSNYDYYNITPDTNANKNDGAQITVTSGQTTHVYITNRQKQAKINVIKDVRNSTGSNVSDDQNFTVQLNNTNNKTISEDTQAVYNVNPGSGYTVSEINNSDYVYKDCRLSTGGLANNFSLSSNEIINITCTNWQKKATVQVVKNVKAADGTTDVSDNHTFKTRLDGSPSSEKDFSETITATYQVEPGNHSITENSDSNYIYVGCTPDSNGGQNGAQFSIDSNESKTITCVNKQKPSSITIVKNSHPDDDTNFEFTRSFGGNFTLDDDGNNHNTYSNTRTFSNLNGGSYTFTENNESGWYLGDIVCVGASISKDLNNRSVTVTLTPDQDPTCTFHNYKKGKIEGEKFYDKDGDNHDDYGEPNLKDWKIFIDENNNGQYDSGERYDLTNHDGYYSFDNLMPATYRVCEEMQTGWYPTSRGGNCKTTTINNDGGDVDRLDFANRQFGSIKVCKVIIDGSGNIVNGSDVAGTTFTVDWDKELVDTVFTAGYTPNTKIFANSEVNDAYCTDYTNLFIDTYHYSQEVIGGNTSIWQIAKYNDQYETSIDDINDFYTYGQNSDSNGEINLALSAGINRTLVILNQYKHGSINVTKFNDRNGNKIKDEGEETLPGWDITLTNQSSKPTDQNGQTFFDKLTPGTYYLNENLKEGWTQTNIYCDVQTVVCGNGVKEIGEQCDDGNTIDNDGCSSTCQSERLETLNRLFRIKPVNAQEAPTGHRIDLSAGQNIQCYIGNQYVPPKLTISKTNNRWPAAQTNGSEVEYTITLNVQENNIKGVSVIDLPPYGFTYKAGSWKVLVNGIERSITEPVYHSPGTWQIGDLNKNDVVTLKYIATIDNSVEPGTYKDAAWAYGYNINNNDKLLASAVTPGYLASTFVGTKIKIDPVLASQDINLVKEEGQVLGASTEMPATGPDTIWAVIFSLLSSVGLGFIIFGFKTKGKKNMKDLIIILFICLASILSVKSVNAVQSSNIFISVENPISPTNKDKFNLSFTALDILNRPLTVKCFKVNPDSSEVQIGANVAVKAGGNSGECSLENYPLTENGKTYYFYAIASAGSDEYRSDSVPVDFNSIGPGTPYDYSKEKQGNCNYKISFRASSDGKTNVIKIYRSELTKFTADIYSQVGQVDIGPDEKGSYLDTSATDCNKTYYYVIRAFDEAGNGSGLAGDFVTVYISTTTPTIIKTSGAIPIIGENNIPAETTITPSGENVPTQTPQSGEVLGSETSNPKSFANQLQSFISRHKYSISLTALILLIIIGYGIKKAREKKNSI